MSPQKIISNCNNLTILKNLVEVADRLLVCQFENNPNFLFELISHCPIILRIGKLSFPEKFFLYKWYPYLFPKEDAEEIEEKKDETEDQINARKYVKETCQWLTNVRNQMKLMNIYRFKQYVEANILQNKINLDIEYTELVREKLAKSFPFGIVNDDPDYKKGVFTVNFVVLGIGICHERFVWYNFVEKKPMNPILNLEKVLLNIDQVPNTNQQVVEPDTNNDNQHEHKEVDQEENINKPKRDIADDEDEFGLDDEDEDVKNNSADKKDIQAEIASEAKEEQDQ